MGGLVLVLLYAFIIAVCLGIGARCRTQYARLTVYGITTTFFLYVFINMAMVMGMLPVVGVPLPLVSYGGTSMLSLMFGFGVILSAHAHRNEWISRFADED
jgi:rod shape determining protein RodA